MDWDHLRFLLALHRAGTLAGAGERLGVNATTVGRRLQSLEEAFGAPLMLKTPDGYRATEAGEAVLGHAQQMQQHVEAMQREAQPGEAAGLVRLTTVETIASGFLAPNLPALREAHPQLIVEVMVTNHRLDLMRGQADLAVRLSRPTEPDLVGQRLVTLELGVYAAESYLHSHPPSERGRGLDLVLYAERLGPIPEARWLEERYPEATVALRTNSVGAVHAAVTAGVGVGVLPVRLGDAEGVTRLDRGAPELSRDLWSVAHPDLVRTQRLRAVTRWLKEVCFP